MSGEFEYFKAIELFVYKIVNTCGCNEGTVNAEGVLEGAEFCSYTTEDSTSCEACSQFEYIE